jgi:hypothetical protein
MSHHRHVRAETNRYRIDSSGTAFIEMDADAFVPAPDDAAPTPAVVAFDPQDELIGKPQGAVGLNRRPGFRQIADNAGDAGRAKLDLASQQHPRAG